MSPAISRIPAMVPAIREAIRAVIGRAALGRAAAVIALVIVAALVLDLVLFGALSRRRQALQQSVSAQSEMLAMEDEFASLKKSIDAVEDRRSPSVRGIVQAVEEVFEPLGIKGKIKSVKPLSSDRAEEDRAEVTVQEVTMNEMVNFLYAVEHAPIALIVRKVNMRQSFENPKVLNVTLTISLIRPK